MVCHWKGVGLLGADLQTYSTSMDILDTEVAIISRPCVAPYVTPVLLGREYTSSRVHLSTSLILIAPYDTLLLHIIVW